VARLHDPQLVPHEREARVVAGGTGLDGHHQVVLAWHRPDRAELHAVVLPAHEVLRDTAGEAHAAVLGLVPLTDPAHAGAVRRRASAPARRGAARAAYGSPRAPAGPLRSTPGASRGGRPDRPAARRSRAPRGDPLSR